MTAAQTLKQQELKSCPFCNGKAYYDRRYRTIPEPEITYLYNVQCAGCHATSQNFSEPHLAIAAWNTRATDNDYDHDYGEGLTEEQRRKAIERISGLSYCMKGPAPDGVKTATSFAFQPSPRDELINALKYKIQAREQWIEELEKVAKPENIGDTSDGYHTFNELYEHRHALFIQLMKSHPRISWRANNNSDGSNWENWFVAGMHLPSGDVSYHMPIRLWNSLDGFAIETTLNAPPWDGHTSDQVVDRLKLFSLPPPPKGK